MQPGALSATQAEVRAVSRWFSGMSLRKSCVAVPTAGLSWLFFYCAFIFGRYPGLPVHSAAHTGIGIVPGSGGSVVDAHTGALYTLASTIDPTSQIVDQSGSTLAPRGGRDIVLWKQGADQSVEWAQSFGGNGTDLAGKVVLGGSSSALFISGFSTSPAVVLGDVRLLNPGGLGGCFLARVSPLDGSVVWARFLGGNVTSSCVTLSTHGAWVYAAGSYVNTPPSGMASGGPASAMFVSKLLQEDGSPVWAKPMGGTQDRVKGISVDASGQVHVVGSFSSSSLTVGQSTLTHGGKGDAFLARWSAEGEGQWVHGTGDSRGAVYNAVVSAGRSGDVYVTGALGHDNILLRRYTSAGALKLSHVLGASDANGYARGVGVVVDESGSIYIAAAYRGTPTLNSRMLDLLIYRTWEFSGVIFYVSTEWMLLLRMSPSGRKYEWATAYGISDGRSDLIGNTLQLGKEGELVATGTFAGQSRQVTILDVEWGDRHAAFNLRMKTAKMRHAFTTTSMAFQGVFCVIGTLASLALLGFAYERLRGAMDGCASFRSRVHAMVLSLKSPKSPKLKDCDLTVATAV
jgi:hypothetical protein